MGTRRARFLYSPAMEENGYPEECPFSSKRAGMTRRTATSLGLLGGPDCSEVAPKAATRDDLLRFHSVEDLKRLPLQSVLRDVAEKLLTAQVYDRRKQGLRFVADVFHDGIVILQSILAPAKARSGLAKELIHGDFQ